MMQDGSCFKVDFRGRLFGQLTSSTFSYLVESHTGPFPTFQQLVQSVDRAIWHVLRQLISQTWEGYTVKGVEVHLRGNAFDQFQYTIPNASGTFPEGSYPPQIAARWRYTSTVGVEPRRYRNLWLPGVPRFTVGAGGRWAATGWRGGCQLATNPLVDPIIDTDTISRWTLRPVIVGKRQPPAGPGAVIRFSRVNLVEFGVGPGRIIRRTPGRGA